jgi:hypothetical protein
MCTPCHSCLPAISCLNGNSIGSVYAAILVLSKQCKVYVVARSNYDVLNSKVSFRLFPRNFLSAFCVAYFVESGGVRADQTSGFGTRHTIYRAWT